MEFSIIIPVYNLERYIEDCLKSCLQQNIDEYEIICVDDGSTDGSAKILDDFANRYQTKIKVLHKENGGVSSARNLGLKSACGEWIWFVDGDDCIKPNCLENLLNEISVNDCDILSIQNTMFDETMHFEHIMNINAPDKMQENIECIAFKVFKSQIIKKHGLCFDETLSHGEDNIFIYEFMKRIKKHHIYKKVIYFYRKRMNSASRSRQIENKRNLYRSQMIQAQYYDDELTEYNTNNYFTEAEIADRRQLFLMRSLMTMCLFECDKTEVENRLNTLIKRKLYPAKFHAKINGSLKEILYGFILRNLGNRKFFMLFWRINRLLKNERK